jgi:hypothetical protein
MMITYNQLQILKERNKMLQAKRWMVVTLMILVALPLVACSESEGASGKVEPAYVESVEDSEFDRVILTDSASVRLDVQTAPAREELVEGRQRLVIPYGAVIYGLNGETWAYTSPEPLTFIRVPITVDFIEGDNAVLSDGPSPGTEVAIVGVAELYGIETGVGK